MNLLAGTGQTFKGTSKEHITVREVLAHQARLPAWISYWQMALDDKGRLNRCSFQTSANSEI